MSRRRWFLVAIWMGVFLHIWQAPVFGQQSPVTKPNEIEIPIPGARPETHVAQDAPSAITTNFVSSSVAEVQKTVPELRGLRVARSQVELPALLEKVGGKAVDLYRKIPNLISVEEVVKSQGDITAARENFSYLILARRGQDAVTLEEFRLDLQTGAKFQTDAAEKPGTPSAADSASLWDDLARASQRVSEQATGAPLTQGFASMWIRFLPSNRSESTFRYLGEQKIDRHQTLVLAFAQKPGAVRLPGEIRFGDKPIPVYYQGIAWVDASDFRIVRLRTDLLAPVTAIALSQLTAEIQFADTQAAGFDSLLWLPRKVAVTSRVNGVTSQEKHSYSKYRSFQVRAKIVLNP